VREKNESEAIKTFISQLTSKYMQYHVPLHNQVLTSWEMSFKKALPYITHWDAR